VDNTNPSRHEIAGTDWQVLGKLELPIDSSADDAVASWLIGTLSARNLQTYFLNKVLKSAQEATARGMQAKAAIKFKHLHLFVFAPSNHVSNRPTWVFFGSKRSLLQTSRIIPIMRSSYIFIWKASRLEWSGLIP
jgi:hypothetical protein